MAQDRIPLTNRWGRKLQVVIGVKFTPVMSVGPELQLERLLESLCPRQTGYLKLVSGGKKFSKNFVPGKLNPTRLMY